MNINILQRLSAATRIPIVIASLLLTSLALAQTPSFDLVITNGHIIDGTGSPWYSGDVGIRDGKIAAIGNLSAAPRKRTIDAAGKVVAPGFIDMLGQSELNHSRRPAPALEDLPGHHFRNYRRRQFHRSAQRRDHPVRPQRITSTTRSLPTGAPSANISRASKSRAWASTSPAMSAPRRSAAWCSVTTTTSPLPRNSSR